MEEVAPPEREREVEEGEVAEAAGAAEILPKLLPGAVPAPHHKQLLESVREPILKTLSQRAQVQCFGSNRNRRVIVRALGVPKHLDLSRR
jgi:hypothetical protein